MSDVEVDRFRQSLATLAESGTQAEVLAYIDEHFAGLPEGMQNEIMSGLLLTSLREEKAMYEQLSRDIDKE